MSQPFNSEEAPQSPFPAKIPPPLFKLGTNVCWNSISEGDPDCGLVVGMRYVWGKHLQDWQLHYIALDANSPSYPWAKFDWGWQEDLTLIPASDSLLNSGERNDR